MTTTESDAPADVRLADAIRYARRLFACGLSDGQARRIVARDYGLDDWDSAMAITFAGLPEETNGG